MACVCKKEYRLMFVTPFSICFDVSIQNELTFDNYFISFSYIPSLEIVKINFSCGGITFSKHIMENTIIKVNAMLIFMYTQQTLLDSQTKDSNCIPYNTIHLPTHNCIEDVIFRGKPAVRKTCFNYQIPLVLYMQLNEIYLLRTLQDANIVSLIDDYIIGYNPCLLLEKGIPMKTFMIKVAYQLENSYYERICLEILRQVSNALGYLHRSNVLHTDIRIEHLILVGNVVKVIDFSNAIAIEHEKREEIFNEQDNRSPEEYKNMIMTQKTDVWQLGIMAFGMIRKNQIDSSVLRLMYLSDFYVSFQRP